MVRESKLFLILTVLAMLLLITSCTSIGSTPKRYYTGYNSVEMRFLQDTPPSYFFYDNQATDPSVNTIPIDVEIYNKGSSNTYGALFIHGFDPNIVAVAGYSNNYPAGLGYTGAVRTTNTFGGYYNSNGNFAGSISVPTANGNLLNLNLVSTNGQKFISFSSLSNGGTPYANRAAMFSSMGMSTQASVVGGNVGSLLNPITQGMFASYGWSSWLKEFQLQGRNSNNPGGGMDVVEFPATIIALPPSLEEFRQRIMVTSCFDYATHASQMVCIDPEPYSNTKKACVPRTVSVGGGQGAPVAVTTIEQKPGRGRTTFVINIHHSRQNTYDELYDYFSLYKCDPASAEIVKSNDKNIVYVGYIYLSTMDITMSCVPDQVMRLDDAGNGQITCSVDFPIGMPTSAYEAPMEIELWYGYSKTIYRDVYVRQI